VLNYELKLAVNQVPPCLRLRSGTAMVVERWLLSIVEVLLLSEVEVSEATTCRVEPY